jgi:hypothetical protein
MMARQLTNDDRRVLAEVLKRVGANWRSSIGDDDFHSLEYMGLFTEIWLRGADPVMKTDCYRFLSGVSRQTAKKYLERAIERGYLKETSNPRDKRSKLITMAPGLASLLEKNYDHAAAELRKVLRRRRPLAN